MKECEGCSKREEIAITLSCSHAVCLRCVRDQGQYLPKVQKRGYFVCLVCGKRQKLATIFVESDHSHSSKSDLSEGEIFTKELHNHLRKSNDSFDLCEDSPSIDKPTLTTPKGKKATIKGTFLPREEILRLVTNSHPKNPELSRYSIIEVSEGTCSHRSYTKPLKEDDIRVPNGNYQGLNFDPISLKWSIPSLPANPIFQFNKKIWPTKKSKAHQSKVKKVSIKDGSQESKTSFKQVDYHIDMPCKLEEKITFRTKQSKQLNPQKAIEMNFKRLNKLAMNKSESQPENTNNLDNCFFETSHLRRESVQNESESKTLKKTLVRNMSGSEQDAPNIPSNYRTSENSNSESVHDTHGISFSGQNSDMHTSTNNKGHERSKKNNIMYEPLVYPVVIDTEDQNTRYLNKNSFTKLKQSKTMNVSHLLSPDDYIKKHSTKAYSKYSPVKNTEGSSHQKTFWSRKQDSASHSSSDAFAQNIWLEGLTSVKKVMNFNIVNMLEPRTSFNYQPESPKRLYSREQSNHSMIRPTPGMTDKSAYNSKGQLARKTAPGFYKNTQDNERSYSTYSPITRLQNRHSSIPRSVASSKKSSSATSDSQSRLSNLSRLINTIGNKS